MKKGASNLFGLIILLMITRCDNSNKLYALEKRTEYVTSAFEVNKLVKTNDSYTWWSKKIDVRINEYKSDRLRTGYLVEIDGNNWTIEKLDRLFITTYSNRKDLWLDRKKED